MTTDRPSGYPDDEDDCPPPRDTDPNCDPKLVDEVACKARGVAAQATYNLTFHDDLEKAKTDYDATRTEYRNRRHEAALQVQDMRHQIRHLVERIKCLIEQRRVWRCLDESFEEILGQLRHCEIQAGCCAEPCDFDIDDDLGWTDLLKRITRYQREVDEAKACFNTLVAEPAALTKRVADAKAAIDGINAALSADPAVTDLKKVYAQALVTNRDIERVWGGFDETHDFVECLCRALTCWTKGCAAVSVLTGTKAIAECKKQAIEAHCAHLKTNTVDEIMGMYDKLCPRYSVGEDPDEPGSGGDHDESDCDECNDEHDRHLRAHGHTHGDRRLS